MVHSKPLINNGVIVCPCFYSSWSQILKNPINNGLQDIKWYNIAYKMTQSSFVRFLRPLLLEPRCSIYSSLMWKNVIWWRGFQSGVHGKLNSLEVFRGSTEFWFKFCIRINSLKLQLQIICSQKCYELNFNTLDNVCANQHVFPLMSRKLKCEPS